MSFKTQPPAPDPKDLFDEIWKRFAEDRRENRANAYINLQRAFCEHAAEIVPVYMTATEHMKMIADIEEYTKGDKQSETGNPLDTVSRWLNGDLELSRIPLEAIRHDSSLSVLPKSDAGQHGGHERADF